MRKRLIFLALLVAASLLLQGALMRQVTDGQQNSKSAVAPDKKEKEMAQDGKKQDAAKTIKVRLIKELRPEKAKKNKRERTASIKKQKKLLKKNKHKHYDLNTSSDSEELLDWGKMLLGVKGENIGKFPPIIAAYDSIGFREYARLINKIGGRFFLINNTNNKIAAAIDVETQKLSQPEVLNGFSPRSRDISNEPSLEHITYKADKALGASNYSVILLFPMRIDFFLYGGIEDYFLGKKISPWDFSYLKGKYSILKGSLILKILSGHLKNGKNKKLNIIFNMGKLAGI